MEKRWIKIFFTICVLTLFSTAAFAAESIKIAVASPFTGPNAGYGDNVKAGVEMKVEEVNKAGGINGSMIEVLWEDDLCVPKEGATVAAKISRNKEVVGVIGHLCSGAHLAGLSYYTRKGIPVISPTATSPDVSQHNKDRKGTTWSFRVVYRDDYQGEFLARYAKQVLKVNKVAVFYENNDYGVGLKDAFVAEAQKIGLTVLGSEAYVAGTPDFAPQLTKLKSTNPEALFLAGYYREGALIAGQAKKLGLDVVKFGADGLDNIDYIKLSDDAAANTYLTTPFLASESSAAAKTFLENFAKRYKRQSGYMSVNAYDATGMMLAAIEKAGKDRAAIREYLAGINTPEKAYKGIGGPIYFNEHGDAQKNAFVKMVQGEGFVPAKQMQ